MSDTSTGEGPDFRTPWDYIYPGGPWHEGRRKTGSIRVGDSERAEMAELLGKHYGDGRLDEQEFRERIDRAMSAKTRGDLAGLLSDLPTLGSSAPAAPVHHRGRRVRPILGLFLVIALSLSVASVIAHQHIAWWLIAIVAFLLLNRFDRRKRVRRSEGCV